jgi:hypothetical protein
MSHIVVHRVEALARSRLARTAQVAAAGVHHAVAGQAADRLERRTWPLDREPYHHARAQGGPRRTIERAALGELVDNLGELAIAPSREHVLDIPTLTTALPEQRTYTLTVDQNAAGAIGISTPPIPWPFEITGCVLTSHGTVNNCKQWNLYITDAAYNGAVDRSIGTPLIEVAAAIDGLGFLEDGTVRWGAPIRGLDAATKAVEYGGAAVGAQCRTAGKRLTFTVHRDNAVERNATNCTITVRELRDAGAPRTSSTRTRLAAAAAIAAAEPFTPAPAPAPTSLQVPSGTTRPSGLTALQVPSGTTRPSGLPALFAAPSAPPRGAAGAPTMSASTAWSIATRYGPLGTPPSAAYGPEALAQWQAAMRVIQAGQTRVTPTGGEITPFYRYF